MSEVQSVIFVMFVTLFMMGFVLYTGESTFKHNGKTLKQTIDDWFSSFVHNSEESE